MKFSIIVTTYNRRDLLARTLPTVLGQDFPTDQYEVVVVVDGSADGTAEMLRALRPACSLVVIEQPNRGQPTALNAGLRAAQGEFLLFLDDDVLCDPALLRHHWDAHQGEQRTLAFGPVNTAPETPRVLATELMRVTWDQFFENLKPADEPNGWFFSFGSPNTSGPRSELQAIGGFDESFRRAQDVDLGIRLLQSGLRFRYCPGARAWHLPCAPGRDVVRRDAAIDGAEDVLLARKHPDFASRLAVGQLNRLPRWRRACMGAAARLPFSLEPLLRPFCWIAERFVRVPPMRWIGLRVMAVRRDIVFFRSAARAAGSWQQLSRLAAPQS